MAPPALHVSMVPAVSQTAPAYTSMSLIAVAHSRVKMSCVQTSLVRLLRTMTPAKTRSPSATVILVSTIRPLTRMVLPTSPRVITSAKSRSTTTSGMSTQLPATEPSRFRPVIRSTSTAAWLCTLPAVAKSLLAMMTVVVPITASPQSLLLIWLLVRWPTSASVHSAKVQLALVSSA